MEQAGPGPAGGHRALDVDDLNGEGRVSVEDTDAEEREQQPPTGSQPADAVEPGRGRNGRQCGASHRP